ncbi:MAG TPA: glutamate--tRNA ligase family protein, partial [Patescibacteria group bacterium]|nr:glutamate--tRNA ligase family protein [Patescibacteria group bacterium]
NITHVIRAEEWLPSTPKHILLYEAFGWEIPAFAHIPLLLNPDKSKLSKRQGDVAVEEYLKKGYLVEALINFIVLLGWNPGQGSTQEIFSLEELMRIFELGNVHKAGAVFDQKKLDWMNAEYIKKLSVDKLYERMAAGGFLQKDFITNAPETMRIPEYLKKVLTIERDRLATLSNVGEQNLFFFVSDLVYDPRKLHWKENTVEMTKTSLERAYTLLSDCSDVQWEDKAILEKILMAGAGDKKGDFLWPLRFALTGADRSPSPFDVAWVLGKEESLKRLKQAIIKLS